MHFTILRPPEKQDGTPINELSLIAFPTADLFGRKIGEFDLIIFDRYSNQSVLPSIYLDNIVKYVREGGALLIAAGPDFATDSGIFSRRSARFRQAVRTAISPKAVPRARLRSRLQASRNARPAGR